MLSSHDNVLVTNNGSEPFIRKFDGRAVGVPPGMTVQVPFDFVRIWLGDPRSGETARVARDGQDKIRIASRSDELNRLMTLYGGSVKQQVEHRVVPISEVAPDLTVQTIEGDKIETVVTDPGGSSPEPIPVELNTPEAVAAQVAQMSRTLKDLQDRYDAMVEKPDDDDVPEDAPTGRAKAGAGVKG